MNFPLKGASFHLENNILEHSIVCQMEVQFSNYPWWTEKGNIPTFMQVLQGVW